MNFHIEDREKRKKSRVSFDWEWQALAHSAGACFNFEQSFEQSSTLLKLCSNKRLPEGTRCLQKNPPMRRIFGFYEGKYSTIDKRPEKEYSVWLYAIKEGMQKRPLLGQGMKVLFIKTSEERKLKWNFPKKGSMKLPMLFCLLC